MKAISALAAVLVVGVLLSGFLVLFTSYHPSSVGSSAPVQSNLAVYAELGGKKSAFYALRPQDGSILWQYHLPDGHTWASGSVVSHGVVYVCADGSVSALRGSDGALLWSHRVGTPGSPFIVDGVLYVGNLQGAVYALRTSDGSQLWRHSTPTLDATIVAVADGLIYTRADGLYVLRTSDGSVAWHAPAFQNVIRPVVVTDGKVYVSVREGRTTAVLRSSDGKPLRSLPLSGDLLAANGFVYILGQEELSAVRASDDKVLWHFQPGSGCPMNSEFSSIYDGTIYEIDSQQTSDVCAFRASDGMLLWHWHQPISDAFSAAVEADGRVYFCIGEKLYALRARDGSLLWYSSWGATGAPAPVVG